MGQICKYFLDAIEQQKYGWFWECPNGVTCHYRHCLPPGYVFKPKGEEKKKEEGIPLEELIEQEVPICSSNQRCARIGTNNKPCLQRAKLDTSKLTPVTPETFAKWKEEQKKKKAEQVEEARKEAAKKSGNKGIGVLGGRALFQFDPSLFVDDNAAEDKYIVTENKEDQKAQDQTDGTAPLYGEDDGTEVKEEALFLDDDVVLPDEETENADGDTAGQDGEAAGEGDGQQEEAEEDGEGDQ